jgi:hypothetical protein
LYEWSPVFQWLIQIKNEYIGRFGSIDLYDAGNERSFVNKWVTSLYGQDGNNINIAFMRCLIANTSGAVVNLHYNTIAVSKTGRLVFPEKSPLEAYASLWGLNDGFLQKCRSICLDMSHEEIVIAPYDKFFNINEMPWTRLEDVKKAIEAEMVKEENQRVLELCDKLDGSFIAASWHYAASAPVLSSSGQFNNEGNVHIGIAKKYMDEAINKMIMENKDLTFMFELLNPAIPIVVRYPDHMHGLHLIGIRDKTTGRTYTYRQVGDFAAKYGVRAIHAVKITDIEDLFAQASGITGVEGWVLNIGLQRYKLKCKEYMDLSHSLMGDVVGANVVKCYCENTADDFISRLPKDIAEEFLVKLDLVRTYEESELAKLEDLYRRANKANRAAFADWCAKEGVKGMAKMNMFRLFDGKPATILYAEKGKERKYIRLAQIEEPIECLDSIRQGNTI